MCKSLRNFLQDSVLVCFTAKLVVFSREMFVAARRRFVCKYPRRQQSPHSLETSNCRVELPYKVHFKPFLSASVSFAAGGGWPTTTQGIIGIRTVQSANSNRRRVSHPVTYIQTYRPTDIQTTTQTDMIPRNVFYLQQRTRALSVIKITGPEFSEQCDVRP